MPDEFPLDRDLLLEVLNRLNIGAYVTDLNRGIIIWNRKAEEITGHKAENVVGTACWDNVLNHVDKDGHELCRTDLCPLRRSILLGVETKDPILVYARRPDGTRAAVSVSTAPLRDPDGNIVGGIETFRDESGQVADMQFAQKIQRHLFPQRLPAADPMEFDVRYFPHDLVGGDFYDALELENGKVGVLVADVRGHGVSAALYTMWLRMLEENFKERAEDPEQMITALNRALARFTLSESFATAIYGVVDPAAGTLEYSNAGHPPPLHYRKASADVAELESHGMPLGVTSDEVYESAVVDLEPGDIILAYTDGLAEVTDREGRMLNAERLSALMLNAVKSGPRLLLDRMYETVRALSKDVALADDCTLLSIRRKP
ncbi:MAG: PP2C family protein-serine/threonine phosphatase [Planctomycetota bacterium]|jgi:PAS domain S-box-containing protein